MTDEERAARRREYARQYRERNRELLAAKQREYAAGRGDQLAEYRKRYYRENREADNARSRDWREQNRERVAESNRSYREANRERLNQRMRGHDGYVKRLKNSHGMTPEAWARMLDAQEGLCCYCENPLPEDGARVHIDHDHACCPPGKSCSYCRRGIACQSCNHIVGFAKDNPDLLIVIAANLAAISAETRERTAAKPQQGELGPWPMLVTVGDEHGETPVDAWLCSDMCRYRRSSC